MAKKFKEIEDIRTYQFEYHEQIREENSKTNQEVLEL